MAGCCEYGVHGEQREQRGGGNGCEGVGGVDEARRGWCWRRWGGDGGWICRVGYVGVENVIFVYCRGGSERDGVRGRDVVGG